MPDQHTRRRTPSRSHDPYERAENIVAAVTSGRVLVEAQSHSWGDSRRWHVWFEHHRGLPHDAATVFGYELGRLHPSEQESLAVELLDAWRTGDQPTGDDGEWVEALRHVNAPDDMVESARERSSEQPLPDGEGVN